MVPWHLRPVCGADDVGAYFLQQLANLEPGRFDMRQQRGRERAVSGLAVERHGVRRRGIGDQGADTALQGCQAAAGRGRPAGDAAQERVVPAGVQNHDAGTVAALELVHDPLQRDRLELEIGLVLELRIDRDEKISARDLQSMAGIEEQRHLGVVQLASETCG